MNFRLGFYSLSQILHPALIQDEQLIEAGIYKKYTRGTTRKFCMDLHNIYMQQVSSFFSAHYIETLFSKLGRNSSIPVVLFKCK